MPNRTGTANPSERNPFFRSYSTDTLEKLNGKTPLPGLLFEGTGEWISPRCAQCSLQ